MLPLDRLTTNAAAIPSRSVILREFVTRQERPSHDQRVDLPEIQESFRVSFSDAASAASTENARTVLQKNQQGQTERLLQAYLAIAEL